MTDETIVSNDPTSAIGFASSRVVIFALEVCKTISFVIIPFGVFEMHPDNKRRQPKIMAIVK